MQSLNVSRLSRAAAGTHNQGAPSDSAPRARRINHPKFTPLSNVAAFRSRGAPLRAPQPKNGPTPGRGIPVRMRLQKSYTQELERPAEAATPTDGHDGGGHPFSGLGASEIPVSVCQTRTLDPVLFLDDALAALQAAVADLAERKPPLKSGIIRIQVPLPPGMKALQWLQGQSQTARLAKMYFSARAPRGDGEGDAAEDGARVPEDVDACGFRAVAGVGAAVLFHDSKPFAKSHWTAIQRFLSKGAPEIKVYGAMRFNPQEGPAPEWSRFGAFYFLIPQVEFCESEGCSMLAVSIAWDMALHRSFDGAVVAASDTLSQVLSQVGSQGGRRTLQVEVKEHVPTETVWHQAVNATLEKLGEAESVTVSADWRLDPACFDELGLSKVVMARRTKLRVSDDVDALTLLASLQEKDPSAYQFCVQLPDGTAFIGSTPERLFARKGLRVASEAVAATRARGHTSSKDLDTGIDLILSEKDHNEFEIVRESIKRNLERVCKHVEVESHKSIIKQARVQHLYGRFAAELHSEAGEFDLLSVLHPTPAVCGHPQAAAREAITAGESFDRGMYAGPVGWFGGGGAEFAVGIRSSLIQSVPRDGNGGANEAPKSANIYLYAGVGVVKSSDPASEWRELELKVSQFEALLRPSYPLEEVVNINALWAKLIVEECCRLGITYFCIAPGSRSSPLAAAAAGNARVTCVSCMDERSLAFHAVGYGRGANKPAAVITSSGTAVSNLLPAVVEASQDCVPVLLLTADRPHELRDTSANQTIDQVKHFGGYVRYHFDLPPADDKLPARAVLTTLDAAAFRARSAPAGPVHINCPFREPLAGSPSPWDPGCLDGLDRWVAGGSPFTTHLGGGVGLRNFPEIAEIVGAAERGLLVVGGVHAADETWAVAMLAGHLGWPVAPDILSGLRVGGDPFPAAAGKGPDWRVPVVHHLDQVLLSAAVADVVRPDVILQIGGRLTSKRIGSFLESSRPTAYILVEEHPFRADPSHVLTHRVQANTAEFVAALMRSLPAATPRDHAFSDMLQALSEAAEREIEAKLNMGTAVTEPFVARAVAASTLPGSTLFLGNSMPIRDVEMYATGVLDQSPNGEFTGLTRRVASNRGASGIDGVLSTAIGFAAGSTRRVTLLVGDVSFIHDTNGLTLLKERVGQPPVTVVVVNNEGGGIFSLLPVANTVLAASFATLWSTQHDVDILRLCRAHRVNHILVRTKDELESALEWVRRSPMNWVVEVESNIERNTEFHRFLQTSVSQATDRAFRVLSMVGQGGEKNGLEISRSELFQYRIPLSAPVTTGVTRGGAEDAWREGFLLRITLRSGATGVGEVAPLEGLHEESLADAKEQLQLLLPMLKGLTLPPTLALLNGSFSAWLVDSLGPQAKTLHPSVRCGLEMAALEALASSAQCTLSELLAGRRRRNPAGGAAPPGGGTADETAGARGPRICALLDCGGPPSQVADAAARLVGQGFCTLKLKVGRRVTPQEDAAVVMAVRARVGAHVNIRADANRKWTYQEAVEFAKRVHVCGLQYLEEPLESPQDIPRFCRETGMQVALDESIDEDASSRGLEALATAADGGGGGVVAVVIKPGRVGGLERAAAVADWAQSRGLAAVISAAFESGVALSAYAHLAAHLDEGRQIAHGTALGTAQAAAHGLGTYVWLGGDVAEGREFEVVRDGNGAMVAPLWAAGDVSRGQHFFNENFVTSVGADAAIESYPVTVTSRGQVFVFRVWDTEGAATSVVDNSSPTLLFLHGFLGTGHEWLPIMTSLAPSFRCIAVDLPGHGQTVVVGSRRNGGNGAGPSSSVSMESVTDALVMLLQELGAGSFVPVGYSMGARIALYLALRHRKRISGVVSISGSPGLEDEESRTARAARDAELAQTIKDGGLESFLESWYQQPMWDSIRQHPSFARIRSERANHKDEHALADALASLSAGRQPSLWADLGECACPALLVAGALDAKFAAIARTMCTRAGQPPPRNPRPRGPSSRKRAASAEAAQKAEWESQGFRLPWEFLKAFPEANMVVPSLDSVAPYDDGFAAFFAQEMAKLQLEDALVLGAAADWPAPGGDRPPPGGDEDAGGAWRAAEVEGCGHAVHVEGPWALVRLLRTFLRGLEGGT